MYYTFTDQVCSYDFTKYESSFWICSNLRFLRLFICYFVKLEGMKSTQFKFLRSINFFYGLGQPYSVDFFQLAAIRQDKNHSLISEGRQQRGLLTGSQQSDISFEGTFLFLYGIWILSRLVFSFCEYQVYLFHTNVKSHGQINSKNTLSEMVPHHGEGVHCTTQWDGFLY